MSQTQKIEASLHHSLFSKCLVVLLFTAESINPWKKYIFKIFDSATWEHEVKGHSSRKDKYCISANFCWGSGCRKYLKDKRLFSWVSSKDWWKVWIQGRDCNKKDQTSSAVRRGCKKIWMKVHKVFDHIVKRRRRSNKRGLDTWTTCICFCVLSVITFRHNKTNAGFSTKRLKYFLKKNF